VCRPALLPSGQGPFQPRRLGRPIQWTAVLAVGRGLGVDPRDGAVGRLQDACQLHACAPMGGRRHPGCALDQGIELREEPPHLLVGFDPGRRRAGVPQHAVGHCPLARGGVVLERQSLPAIWQVVERALVHRLTDLALDEALPGMGGLRPTLGVATLWTHGRNAISAATGELTRGAATVRLHMDRIDGRPVYSATDLVAFLACEHLTQLERAAIAGLVKRPMRDDPELDVIRRRGFQHEARFLADLRAEGRRVVEIATDGSTSDRGEELRAAAALTIEAMASGADVIYQATFFDGTFRGHADFLLRVEAPDRPSRWGPYHYEVADTKLARHVKASAILQICSYIDQLERIQGVRPEWLHVALGGSARAVERLRVDDYMAYYRGARDRFLGTLADETPPTYPPTGTYPDPVEHCDVCRWAAECVARRRADDHLSLVAGISGRQRRALGERGIGTLEALGDLPLPMEPPLKDVGSGALLRVREQARIQLEGRREARPKYELFIPDPGEEVELERGLASLPPPSPGDLFFDIEGDPYAFDDGLDYLFGVLETDDTFHAIWSRDDADEFSLEGERHAFERLIDLIMGRLERDPTLHVYHYAPYEPTALKRLMGRYGTREAEVDRLLREGVLVDLLRIVRQSMRASVESYSIKRMEIFYGFEREIDLRDAGSSIVAFEQWLELGEGERPASTHLDRIERYNRDDVVSNRLLRDWLEGSRAEFAELAGREVPRPAARVAALPPELTEAQARVEALVQRLAGADVVPTDPADRTPSQQATWLLAQLLGWHRREDKSMWWEFHRLMDLTPEQLVDEDDPIGLLEPAAPVDDERKGKQTWRYTFPTQDYDLGRGQVFDPAQKQARPDDNPFKWATGDVVALDPAARTVDLRRPVGEPHPRAIVPLPWVPTKAHQAALFDLGRWVADHGIQAAGPTRAGRDLLFGLPPRVSQWLDEPLRGADESGLQAARRLAATLDHTTLAIQGPPGSGKTFTGARMVCTLLSAGKRVGITATSHKVIGNFLKAVLDAASLEGVAVLPIQKGTAEEVLADPRVTRGKDAADIRARLDDGRANLAAGTSWLWASPRMADSVDVLFVDEAGQISLANVVAIAGATDSLVLLGDPQQLDQPLRGTHPPGADRSALAHVLGDAATMPPTHGLFLENTWRLHPDLCAFTSEVFYDDRLGPEPSLAGQTVTAGRTIADGTGPRLLDVPTVGADNESPVEADAVAALARSIVDGGEWTDASGVTRHVGWDDVLIVAPYNAQVGEIKRRLPVEARVGTVDKFQGQESPISIYSMTTSTPELAPRGMDFLYSRHRLNVATSRARCISVVVASPELFRVRARTPEQMRLANAFCRFAELATPRVAEARVGGAANPR
jgi:predicted RecB family nuclease